MVKYIDKNVLIDMLPIRPDDANKGTFKKVLNIAGSSFFIGAAYLSSASALKIGAGFVSLATPRELIYPISSIIPELTYIPLKSTDDGVISADNNINNISDFGVVSLGCGITNYDEPSKFILKTISSLNDSQSVVVDADGINILAASKLDITLKNAIITPHPKELSRLLNVELSQILEEREKYARLTSEKYECITVLKGHDTIITNGDECYINTTGSSALAKAGTGDVLTGIISGLLSQNADLMEAAILGTYLHGLSGDIAADYLTNYSVLASDVIEYIPYALNELINQE